MQYKKAEEDIRCVIEACLINREIKKSRDKFISKLKDRINKGKTLDVFNRDLPVLLLKQSDLYYILKVINEYNEVYIEKYKKSIKGLEEIKLNPNYYFTEIEIDNFELEPLINYDLESNEIILDNCYKVTENQFSIPRIHIVDLVDLFYKNFVKYDKSMQRESQKVSYRGVEYETPKIYKTSVKAITSEMMEGTYIPTAISVNVLKTGDEKFIYDDENNRIYLYKEDRNSLIDGMHRTCSAMDALIKNPNCQQIMQLNIFNFDITEARHYIYQEAQKNAISRELLQKYNTNNEYALLAIDIERDGNKKDNLLQGKIGNEKKDVEVLDKFTTFAKLSEALEDNFKIDKDDIRIKRKMKKYLVEYFNELISIMKDSFKDVKKSRTEDLKLHPNMIYLYCKIAKDLYGVDDWEELLETIISSIDFNDKNIFDILMKVSADGEVAINYELNKKNKNILYDFVDVAYSKAMEK